jgi:acyl-CoA thioesterase I
MNISVSAGVSLRIAVARTAVLLIAVGGLGTAVLTAEAAASRLPKAPSGRVVVLGDSLAVAPSPRESFPARLQDYLIAAKLNLTVVNAGRRGDTTAGGLRRLRPLLTTDTRMLIVELGANDGLRGVDISQIERNLSTIIETAQRKRIPVLLCGMLVPPRYGWEYAVAFPELFQRVATKYRVPLVPFLLDGVALIAKMNGPDGIHPNAAGAKRMADTVWEQLESALEDDQTVAATPSS